jgi:hypothetical protein
MLKDMWIAPRSGRVRARRPARRPAAVELRAEAAEALPADADHTEIARWLGSAL